MSVSGLNIYFEPDKILIPVKNYIEMVGYLPVILILRVQIGLLSDIYTIEKIRDVKSRKDKCR